MTDVFKVAIVAHTYTPDELRRLGALLKTNPAKLARHLRSNDLVVKRNVDEMTAQRYAALIYEKTGAEALVLGGPDLASLPASDKPKATKARAVGADAKPGFLRPLWIAAIGSVLFAVLVSLLYISRQTLPTYAPQHLHNAMQVRNSAKFERHVPITDLWQALQSDVATHPELAQRFASSLSAPIAVENLTVQWLRTGHAEQAPPLLQLLFGALQGAAEQPSLVSLVSESGDEAVITTRFYRADLDLAFQPQWRLKRQGEHWVIEHWVNAPELLTALVAAEEQALKDANQQVQTDLAALIKDFSYQESIAGVHRFSLGQLRIQAQFVNGSNQSLQALEGELFVYGVETKQVYASKPFHWQARERQAPPGGSMKAEVFFSLDGAWPALVEAIEKNREPLEVGYRISQATFRTGEVLAAYQSYDELRLPADAL